MPNEGSQRQDVRIKGASGSANVVITWGIETSANVETFPSFFPGLGLAVPVAAVLCSRSRVTSGDFSSALRNVRKSPSLSGDPW